MCGIHGIVDRRLESTDIIQLLRSMAVAQQHRGPDDRREAVFEDPAGRVGLGFVRLSILDLETGMQPIRNPETGSAIICNGQVFNYRDLRQQFSTAAFQTRGDIEPVLHLYDRIGSGFLSQLNGMYAGAIYSPQRRQLLLFNDRFGIKPLYYTHRSGRFCFASEIKALRCALPEDPAVDQEALSLYLAHGYVPGEKTLFDGVSQLLPGTCLTYDLDTGELTTTTYWRYRPQSDPELTLDEAADRFVDLLEDSVRLRCHADVPVGSLLSSGIDSCAIASIASRIDPGLELFSVAFEDDEFDESSRVRAFASDWLEREADGRFVQTTSSDMQILSEVVHHLDEPLAMTSLLPTWKLMELVGGSHKVVLTGEGADEIFAGYGWFWLEPQDRRQNRKTILQLYQGCRSFFEIDEVSALLGLEEPKVDIPEELCIGVDTNYGPLETILQMESRCRFPAKNLARLDRMAMAHSVETRTPFLDYRIAELAARLSADLKLGPSRSTQKHLCREAFLRRGVLPEQVARLPKQPFCAPVDAWFREEFDRDGRFREIADFSHPLFEDLVDPEVARKTTAGFFEDQTSPFKGVTQFERFWNLAMLAIWYEQVMLRESKKTQMGQTQYAIDITV